MKITPMGAQRPAISQGNGQTATPMKLAAARAIAAGKPAPVQEAEPRPETSFQRPDVKRIRMHTNRTVLRDGAEPPLAAPEEIAQTDVDDATATEETKPLSPQLAALAKQRRALQVKERELVDREKALLEKGSQGQDSDLAARLKSQPLSVLQEHGVTYEQLTEAILASNNQGNPEVYELQKKIAALEEGVNKNFQARDDEAELQVLREFRSEAERLAQGNADYEMIAKTNSYDDVVDIIHQTWKKRGKILSVDDVMKDVEEELINDVLKYSSSEKIISRLQPAQPQQQQRTVRSLTSRDGVIPPMTRSQRAIAAFHGTLKK